MKHLKSVNEFFNFKSKTSLLDKIKKFGEEIRSIAQEFTNTYNINKLNSEKDILKLSLSKQTFSNLKSFYNDHKEQIDKAYEKTFATNEGVFNLKNFFFILLFLAISSCHKVMEKSHSIKMGITKKEFIEGKSELTYHWGLNMRNMKYEWHWGMENIPDKYLIYIDDKGVIDDKKMFDDVEEGDSINGYKVDVYVDSVYKKSYYKYKNRSI